MPKVLVVGGAGLVGGALVRAWKARKTQVFSTATRPRPSEEFLILDMRDEARVREVLGSLRPDLVAVPAANPFVDYCEQHPAETRAINVAGTLNVARACRDAGARMIFYSSDYVFDGARGGYTEEDATNPLNEYGRQKVEAERGVLAADPRNLVLRAANVYGWEAEPKNLVLQLRKKLSAGQEVPVADDLRCSPTYSDNLAEMSVALAEAGASGVFHACGADSILRYEFARKAARAFGLDERLVKALPSSQMPSSVRRPKEGGLSTAKIRAAIGVAPLGADEGLRRMRASEPRS